VFCCSYFSHAFVTFPIFVCPSSFFASPRFSERRFHLSLFILTRTYTITTIPITSPHDNHTHPLSRSPIHAYHPRDHPRFYFPTELSHIVFLLLSLTLRIWGFSYDMLLKVVTFLVLLSHCLANEKAYKQTDVVCCSSRTYCTSRYCLFLFLPTPISRGQNCCMI